jgi:hypothetical protein
MIETHIKGHDLSFFEFALRSATERWPPAKGESAADRDKSKSFIAIDLSCSIKLSI